MRKLTYIAAHSAARTILLAMLLIWAGTANVLAQKTYTPDNLPKTHIADRTRYVVNPSDILSQAVVDSIDAMFYRLEQQTGIESVIAVVPSIGEAECFDFCHELMNSWGVGKKDQDNGLVVLLVIDQRCIQFYTGYGLEGILPDALCKRIQLRDMLPYLRDNDWDNAMMAGMQSVVSILDGSMEPDTEEEDDDALTLLFVAWGFGGLVFGLACYSSYRQSKCPHCGKYKLTRTHSQQLYHRDGIRMNEVTFTCSHCGHQVKRREKIYDSNGSNTGGPIILGGGGSFGGGGGSFGGSFGGGSGGGGGAGTRF